MIDGFHKPPAGFGPGSQPVAEEEQIDWLPMPSGMRTYDMHVPEVEDIGRHAAVVALLEEVAQACAAAAEDGVARQFDVAHLKADDRRLLAEIMGAGEVSLRVPAHPGGEHVAQESVFAGVWQVAGPGHDLIEVAPVPQVAMDHAFSPQRRGMLKRTPRQPGVVNAPPLLVELMDKAAQHRPGMEPHVINMSLLPHTPEDLEWLDMALGVGGVVFLSRGYGNCRISATALKPVWRVQYFNSVDALILDTFEVCEVPAVVVAAPEDLRDSAQRIGEVMEAMQ